MGIQFNNLTRKILQTVRLNHFIGWPCGLCDAEYGYSEVWAREIFKRDEGAVWVEIAVYWICGGGSFEEAEYYTPETCSPIRKVENGLINSVSLLKDCRFHSQTTFIVSFLKKLFRVLKLCRTLISTLVSNITCWSQWPGGLMHEMSSPVQTLGSWVGNLLETWVYISAFLCLCLVLTLRTANLPS